jgi:hypothetical protein
MADVGFSRYNIWVMASCYTVWRPYVTRGNLRLGSQR